MERQAAVGEENVQGLEGGPANQQSRQPAPAEYLQSGLRCHDSWRAGRWSAGRGIAGMFEARIVVSLAINSSACAPLRQSSGASASRLWGCLLVNRWSKGSSPRASRTVCSRMALEDYPARRLPARRGSEKAPDEAMTDELLMTT